MKKTMTRNIVIMAIVTVIMAVVLSLYIKSTGTVPAADSTASLADGTYTASEQGCLSEVAVTVTVTGGKVTNVAIDASGETPELGGAAAETLADELTKAGSTAGVDAVSGATLTSNAVFTAMDSCLAQAGTGSAGAEDLTDGTYTSSAKGCLSDVEVTVTVSGGKVSEVAIDASGETPELGCRDPGRCPDQGRFHQRRGCCFRRDPDQRGRVHCHERLPEPGPVRQERRMPRG